MTLTIHFLVKKTATPTKPFSFPLQQSFPTNPYLIFATFLLSILTVFPQNLVSYPQ